MVPIFRFLDIVFELESAITPNPITFTRCVCPFVYANNCTDECVFLVAPLRQDWAQISYWTSCSFYICIEGVCHCIHNNYCSGACTDQGIKYSSTEHGLELFQFLYFV